MKLTFGWTLCENLVKIFFLVTEISTKFFYGDIFFWWRSTRYPKKEILDWNFKMCNDQTVKSQGVGQSSNQVCSSHWYFTSWKYGSDLPSLCCRKMAFCEDFFNGNATFIVNQIRNVTFFWKKKMPFRLYFRLLVTLSENAVFEKFKARYLSNRIYHFRKCRFSKI